MWMQAAIHPCSTTPHALLLAIFFLLLLITHTPYDCIILAEALRQYCLPHSVCWPDVHAWDAFNTSVDGRLLRPRPSAAPCHSHVLQHDAHDDNVACEIAKRNWHNPFWRSDQPGAMQIPNWEWDGDAICKLAPSSSPCYQGAVPAYSVQVSEASHVQSSIAFAAQHNLRLTVKSTGHDFMGRSTAPGSLNIWMHHLKGITFFDAFTPEGCSCNGQTWPVAAVRAGAGVQWVELYKAADARGRVVVGGMSGTVSNAGGYLQGGGHSPLSPLLGLAADNTIELRVVMADGQLKTANACQNKDLFWALRGGGGGTFGVVVSATHRTYPALVNIVGVQFTVQASSVSSFEGLVAKFVELQGTLSDADAWAGYSYFSLTAITGSYVLPKLDGAATEEAAREAFEPIRGYAEERRGEISYRMEVKEFGTFLAWWSYVQCRANPGVCSDATGSNAAIASWLLPKEVVQEISRAREVAEVYMQVLAELKGVEGVIIGHLVGGRQVAWAGTNQNNSVNPAWRQATWHIVVAATWTDDEAGARTQEARMRVVTHANGRVRALAPESGCYLNEADFNQPDWHAAFFGRHYAPLSRLKRFFDPHTLFSCRHCIGSPSI